MTLRSLQASAIPMHAQLHCSTSASLIVTSHFVTSQFHNRKPPEAQEFSWRIRFTDKPNVKFPKSKLLRMALPPGPRPRSFLPGGTSPRDRNSLKLVYENPVGLHDGFLSKKLEKLYHLRNLMLDDSTLWSLRDLGSSLPNITTLSVMRCGLRSLDGASALPNLEHLSATDNEIVSPSPLVHISKIRYVDLSGNTGIVSFEGFQFIGGCCDQLRCLKLCDTALALKPEFHSTIKALIPSLKDLHPRTLTSWSTHGQSIVTIGGVDDSESEADSGQEAWSLEKWPVEQKETRIEGSGDGTTSSAIGSALTATATATTATPGTATNGLKLEDIELNREEILSKLLDRQLSSELSLISGIIDASELEKRMRDVSRPEKRNFTLRGAAHLVPSTIEEMDAVLEDLDDRQKEKDARRRQRHRHKEEVKAMGEPQQAKGRKEGPTFTAGSDYKIASSRGDCDWSQSHAPSESCFALSTPPSTSPSSSRSLASESVSSFIEELP